LVYLPGALTIYAMRLNLDDAGKIVFSSCLTLPLAMPLTKKSSLWTKLWRWCPTFLHDAMMTVSRRWQKQGSRIRWFCVW
jgi:hypothetical protein